MTGKNPTHIGDKRAGDRRNKEEKGEWVTQSSMAKEFFFEEKTREKNDSDCKKKYGSLSVVRREIGGG